MHKLRADIKKYTVKGLTNSCNKLIIMRIMRLQCSGKEPGTADVFYSKLESVIKTVKSILLLQVYGGLSRPSSFCKRFLFLK